ncbi:HTH-type transcriptional regulator / antitoxin MqsA [Azotobacter beijerinckii]|uniref:HTH-type transcriptional regulator / antitoxin MqsA n=1 Tax=Azotobacter beijerinckii TaxID=170623 RepID=A0A1H6VPF9_9GAMM|nr:type II toxin-antitoxin system MqsA family antitoxin [Azotobacter beijerinckii]SEJ06539.1 HTH-type transcriptional regulator / antitoxin MqsA [Azotobacter beijerinckii]
MATQAEICPICGEGHLHAQVGEQVVDYRGQSSQIAFHYAECDACGSEQAGAAQLRDNKRAMTAFKKQVDGLLSGTEIRALREELGITQADAARVFGGGPVAFAKYEANDVAQSEAMDKLLRLALEVLDARRWLFERAGLPLGDSAWRRVEVAVPAGRDKQRAHLRVVAQSCFDADDYRYAS